MVHILNKIVTLAAAFFSLAVISNAAIPKDPNGGLSMGRRLKFLDKIKPKGARQDYDDEYAAQEAAYESCSDSVKAACENCFDKAPSPTKCGSNVEDYICYYPRNGICKSECSIDLTNCFGTIFVCDGEPYTEEVELADGTRTTCTWPGCSEIKCSSSSGGGRRRGCFSANTSVEVLGKGLVDMEDLKVGNKVKVSGGTNEHYEPVFSFGHYQAEGDQEYLNIFSSVGPLEVTGDHIVYITDKNHMTGKPTGADSVIVGDFFISKDGVFVPVTKITRSVKK